MAKENPTQPLFALARAVFEECDKQAERWLDYGTSQAGEAAKMVRTFRAQVLGAGRTMFDTVENLTRSAS